MKTTPTLLLALLCGAALAPAARAQASFGAHLGYDVDVEELFVGAQARFSLPTLPIALQPGVDYFFVDNATLLQFDVNGIYDISGGPVEPFTPYVGAGLGIRYIDVDNVDASDTSYGLNLLAGARFNTMPRLRPYVQARMTIKDGTSVGVMAGLLF